MSIPNLLNKIKGYINNIDKNNIMYSIIIISIATCSFLLGRLSVLKNNINKNDILIKGDNNLYKNNLKEKETLIQNQTSNLNINQVGEKMYVASKNGKMYYSKDCGGAKRIKPENRLWFSTKEEAEKSGYELSSLCK